MLESITKRLITFVGMVWGILTAYSVYVILGYPDEFPQIMVFFNLILVCGLATLLPIYRYFGWEFR
jgi:hypothetical protein